MHDSYSCMTVCIHQKQIQNQPKQITKTRTEDKFIGIHYIAQADLKIKLRDKFKAFAKETIHLSFDRRFSGPNSISKLLLPFMTFPFASGAFWTPRKSRDTDELDDIACKLNFSYKSRKFPAIFLLPKVCYSKRWRSVKVPNK